MLLHFTRDTSSELSIACSQPVVWTHDELSVLRGSSFLNLFTATDGGGGSSHPGRLEKLRQKSKKLLTCYSDGVENFAYSA
jgi:hypothetical protein